MSNAVFLRALDPEPEAKGAHLRKLVEGLREGVDRANDDQTFSVDPAEFEVVPGSPFAYWVGEPIRRIFREFPPLEGNVGTVKQGLATADDFRFVRAWWEVDARKMGYSPEDTEEGRGWVHFAKGGSYSPYYADVHLMVNWFGRGAEIKNYVIQRYPYLKGKYEWVVKNEEFYFRPGLTWPLRTTSGLSMRRQPCGNVFGHKGPVIFCEEDDVEALSALQGVLQSSVSGQLLETMLAAATAAARSYEVGVLQAVPIRLPAELVADLAGPVNKACEQSRAGDLWNENSHAFAGSSLAVSKKRSIRESLGWVQSKRRESQERLADLHSAIERAVSASFGLEVSDQSASPMPAIKEVAKDLQDGTVFKAGAEPLANLMMWAVGTLFGRWDVRMLRDSSLLPPLQHSFEFLPRLAPAGLVAPDGLPATPNRIASEAWLRARPDVISLPEPGSFDGPASITAAEYPIDVAWNGILVDDPDHEWDIVRKVREVLEYVYGDRAQAIEDEALEIVRADGRTPRTLRDWFRNQRATELGKSFFDFHIQRYSKSRRKAPIYWRLCTSPGRGQSDYGVWLYYHCLTDDTLWTVLNEYVGPKRELEERRVDELRERVHSVEGAERRRIEDEVEEKQSLLEELRWFEGELRKVAERGYAPDLDDGVVINMAPLHAAVPWKEPEKIWKKLEKGEYDWAKLAMKYWPERVREKCQEDRSLAIAHGLSEAG